MGQIGFLNQFKTRRFILGIWQVLLITSSVLLAFAINNWNERRKERQEQIATLKAIKRGVENDLVDLRINANDYRESVEGIQYLRRSIHSGSYNPDTLNTVLADIINPSFFLSNPGPFETLKSRGVELIQNDSLRDLISSYYHYTYQLIAKFEEHSIDFTYEVLRPMVFEHIDFSERGANFVNIERLQNSFKLDGELGYAQSVALLNQQANNQEIEKAEQLIHLLEIEINTLED